MNNLKVSGLNLDIAWKNKNANFEQIESLLTDVQSDIILLPEMFATGFYMQPDDIADRNDETLNWMKKFATAKKAAVCGSVSVSDGGKFYNRFYFVEPNGNHYQYDKRHLFSFSGEHNTYAPGTDKIIVNYKEWRILLQVCYDLRFPVFSRNVGDYDAIFYVANWPGARIDAWETLLKARAIENQSYVFGLNRIGTDGNNLHYPESSYGFGCDGKIISKVEGHIVTAEFNAENLKNFRGKFQFLNDRDDFKII